jgi:hypothetical protein
MNTDRFAVMRYKNDGSLDPTFNSIGVVTTPLGNDRDFGVALVIGSAGKIVCHGRG